MKKLIFIMLALFLLPLVFGCSEKAAGAPAPAQAASASQTQTPEKTLSATPEPEKPQGYVSSAVPSRSSFIFTTAKNGVKLADEADPTIPPYVDIITVRRQIDETDIHVYIEVRSMPQTLTINQSGIGSTMRLEYCWYISFDTIEDGLIDYNATFNHDRFWQDAEEIHASVDSEYFRTVVLQHQVRSDYTVAQGDFTLDGNTLILHIAKNGMEELVAITEDTPFCVFSESVTADQYFCDIVPKN